VSGTASPVIRWRSLIVASDNLTSNARLVAFVLSTHMDRNGGSCFPSITTLQREAGVARSTVCRALNQLEREGLLERARGGRGRPTRYRATSATGVLVDVELVPQADSTSATGVPEDVQEGVQNIFTRADARSKGKRARAKRALPDLSYLDEAGGHGT
jgi:DNA-binding transcriptional MocR family regulator